jgi:hypothetical protein
MFNLNTTIKIPNTCEFAYSKIESRPSKTLINPEIFNNFQKLKVKELIIYDIIDIDDYNKVEFFLIELSKKLNIPELSKCEMDYNSIHINEIENINFLFSIENNLNQINLIINIINILNEINNINYNNELYVIINIENLYNYTNLEIIILFSQVFDKFYIYYSKILKQDIIIFKRNINLNTIKTSNNIYILKIFKNIYNTHCKKLYLKNIGFYINNDIIKYVKNYNNCYMQYYIDYNNKMLNLNMLENINFKYYKNKKLNIEKCNNYNCHHTFENFNLEKCLICNKCFELFQIY